jgi:hypothetical protein
VFLDGTPQSSIGASGTYIDIPSKAAGTYALEVINSDGCSFTDSIVVENPPSPLGGSVVINSTTNVKVLDQGAPGGNDCFFADQYTVISNVSGGWEDPNYGFQWQYKLSTSSVWLDLAGETTSSLTILPWSFNGNSNTAVDVRLVVTDSGANHQDCVYTTAGITLAANLTGPSPC